MDFDQADKLIETRVGTLEQMLWQLLAEQMAANANGGGAAGMNVPVMPVIGGGSEDVGCYRIVRTDTDGGGTRISFENRYVQLAGKLYAGPSSTYSAQSLEDKFLAIVANFSSPSGETTFSMQTYASLSALQEAQENPNSLVIPLYEFDGDGDVKCDFRTVPYEWQMNYS